MRAISVAEANYSPALSSPDSTPSASRQPVRMTRRIPPPEIVMSPNDVAAGPASTTPSLSNMLPFGIGSVNQPNSFSNSSNTGFGEAFKTPMLSGPPSSSAGGEPDYFASVHVPHSSADGTGSFRIASPFTLPGGATSPLPTAGADHSWAAIFGDGGMKTALPDDMDARTVRMPVPPTPAADPESVPKKGALNSSQPPAGGFAGKLNLPGGNTFKLPAGGLGKAILPTGSSLSGSSCNSTAEDLSRFKALDVDALAEALASPDWAQKNGQVKPAEDVLVLDIRPSTSFLMARIQSSINICAPSTLLKRPGITVERIEDEMLTSNKERHRFMRWRKGLLKGETGKGNSAEAGAKPSPKKGAKINIAEGPGIKKIIVLDTDTARVKDAGNATAGGGGPCLIGMLKKFEAAGYAGELCWLIGGFNKLASSAKGKSLIQVGPNASEAEYGDESSSTASNVQAVSGVSPESGGDDATSRAQPPTLKLPKGPSLTLPASTGMERKGSLVQPRGLPIEAFQAQSTVTGWPGQAQADKVQAGSNLDVSRTGQGDSRKSISNLGQSACANPFFDNIRQNRELAHGITEKIPMDLPQMSTSQIEALPAFLKSLVTMSAEERATTLAQTFFDVERAEQNRLITTMHQHAAASGEDPRAQNPGSEQQRDSSGSSTALLSPSSAIAQQTRSSAKPHDFPFSIAAALERGSDNRYNNIWTYEHSRVRLNQPQSQGDPGSDYVNGSFVQPAQRYGSKRRYIATQAPLPTTFEAFWTAIWEQNSRVIVMLTREHESGRIQSHPYWTQSEFGPNIRVDKLEEVVLDEAGRPIKNAEAQSVLNGDANGGGMFSSTTAAPSTSAGTPSTIRRSFRVRNLAEPSSSPRQVIQLQFIAWPDYHIPETPESLLTLMDMADSAQNEADIEMRQIATSSGRSASPSEPHAGPMVVHCSAGVGRTGAFIVINSALDVLRRCRRNQQGLSSLPPWDNGAEPAVKGPMDVDMPMATPSRTKQTRRSLKRELSPTGMDIDGSHDDRHGHDVSCPPPMLRSRSNDGSNDTLDVGSCSSSNSSVGTPSRAFGSLQIAASSRFANPFNNAAKLTPADEQQRQGALMADKGPSKFLFGNPATGADQYRQGSSPFSEVSTPSLPPGSARSSFSCASAADHPPSLLRSTSVTSQSSETSSASGSKGVAGSLTSSRSIDSLNRTAEALNPFDAAMGRKPTEGMTSTTSESNEPTPFPTYAQQQQQQQEQNKTPAANSTAYTCGDDIIRKSVFTAREQRMSLIQTCRQFVFVYSAILSGLLRDFRKDGIH